MKQSLLALMLVLVALPSPVNAFTVGSAVTASCHETVTIAAYFLVTANLPTLPDEAVPEGRWEDVMDRVYPDLDVGRGEKFIIFSLVAGVRSFDSQGHSLTNLTALRAISGERNGQYIHCLRAQTDDYDAGNATALAGCRASIVGSLMEAGSYIRPALEDGGLIDVPFALDNYGSFFVEVSGLAFYLGRALHTFADSFTHTLRTPDLRRVVHVMNFEAATFSDLDEDRDGIPHSAGMDSCQVIADATGEVGQPRRRLWRDRGERRPDSGIWALGRERACAAWRPGWSARRGRRRVAQVDPLGGPKRAGRLRCLRS